MLTGYRFVCTRYSLDMAAPITEAQLLQTIAAHEARIASLVQQVASFEARLSSLASSTSRPRRRLADPEKFDGQRRWDTWKPLAEAVLRLDYDAIGGNESCFFWLYGNLESKIQAMVLPQISVALAEGVWNTSSIFDQLARVYGNPSKEDDALGLLHGIKQRSESTAVYLANFERLLYEAKQTKMPDASKIAILKNGASDNIKKKLSIQLALPTTYNEFTIALHRLGSAANGHFDSAPYASNSSHSNSSTRPPWRPSTPAPSASGDTMDLTRVRLRGVSQSDYDDACNNEVVEYNTGEGNPAVRSIRMEAASSTDRRVWRKAGLCTGCGSQYHWVTGCPERYPSPASGTFAAGGSYNAHWDDKEPLRY